MARQQYEKSPRQRTEWFGGRTQYNVTTATGNAGLSGNSQILTCPPRLALSAGTIDNTAFPAGIVRGESCSIARFIAQVHVYDVDRRQQNISFETACGLLKMPVEDTAIADPIAEGPITDAPDPLVDLRASWLWHSQMQWNPQSAGANYTVYSQDFKVDSTNSRVFESNEIALFCTQIRTLQNGGTGAVALTARVTVLWRCLLRLD